jgi:hypothetical protein
MNVVDFNIPLLNTSNVTNNRETHFKQYASYVFTFRQTTEEKYYYKIVI